MAEPIHVLTILAVAELPKAVAFYAQAFGWRQIVDAPVYAEFEVAGGMRIGLYERTGFARNIGQLPAQAARGGVTATELYFHVRDMEAAMRRMREAEATVLSELAPRDWGDEAAYFADPDGNVLVLARPLTGD